MPGSLVDVVLIVAASGMGEADTGSISRIVLENIKVLASGLRIDSAENQSQPSSVKAVTLQVTHQQAEKLLLVANKGKLQLVIRNTAISSLKARCRQAVAPYASKAYFSNSFLRRCLNGIRSPPVKSSVILLLRRNFM